MAQDLFNNLRKPFDFNAKAKNPQDTDLLEPGAKPKTPAESETNKVQQYSTGSGGTSGPLGGLPSGV